MTMSAVDFLDQWFETDVLKATMSASGHHRHLPRRALAGHRLRAAPPLHGRDRRRVPLLGLLARRHRRDLASRSPARRARRGSRSAPRRPSRASRRRAAASRVSCSRTATRSTRRVVLSSVDPRITFLKLCEPGDLPAEFLEDVRPLQVPRLVGQGQPRARRPAGLHLPAGTGRAPARARSRSRRASSTWSAPTTTPSTATSRAGPTSTSSSRRSPTPRSRRPAST